MFVVPVEVFFSFVVSVDFPLVFAFGPWSWFGEHFVVWCTHGIDEMFLVFEGATELGTGELLKFDGFNIVQNWGFDGLKEFKISQWGKLLNFFDERNVLFIKRGVIDLSIGIIDGWEGPIVERVVGFEHMFFGSELSFKICDDDFVFD